MSNKNKRPYKLIDKQVIAEFTTNKLLHGNGTNTIRNTDTDYKAPNLRAHRIVTKANDGNITEFIDKQLEANAVQGIKRIGQLTQSERENIALQASIYSVDQYKGKAIQRTHSINTNITIDTLLD